MVLPSIHNLGFGTKIRRNHIYIHTLVLLYKTGAQRAILFRCFPDDLKESHPKARGLVTTLRGGGWGEGVSFSTFDLYVGRT